MDPLAGLDEVDWSTLHHAYGSANDVPPIIRQLAQPDLDLEQLRGIYGNLYANLYHQGTRYSASVAAVPFLIAIVDTPTTYRRDQLLSYLTSLAVSDPSSLVMHGFNIADLRAAMDQVLEEGYVERENEKRAQYISEAANEEERKDREMEFMFSGSIEGRVEETVIDVQVYDAVKSGLPVYRRLLKDASARVRSMAAFTIAWFPEEIEENSRALFEFVQNEQDGAARSTGLVALGILQTSLHATPAENASSSIGQRISEVFTQTQQGDLAHFCAALGMGMLNISQPEHLDEILRKVSDPTYLEDFEPRKLDASTAFPFASPNIVSLASSALGSVKGSENPSVPLALAKALPSSRGETTLFITTIALRTAFDHSPPAPANKPEELPPFESLTAAQQEVIRALTKVDSFNWMFANFMSILRGWGLYSGLAQLQRYAGIEPDPAPPSP
ncbi:hypothetical protein HMN09_01277700 [Mycena chlorophos]|uniref:Uncharacterized protein n=1 Tax=Mycena chlorophos TaxID=658473 RepID=A0A8H6S141_MYCCL|nr:hypothetical protein HMN09_01277700 [Mycena chlorophos]